jgi:hypothetical protein
MENDEPTSAAAAMLTDDAGDPDEEAGNAPELTAGMPGLVASGATRDD